MTMASFSLMKLFMMVENLCKTSLQCLFLQIIGEILLIAEQRNYNVALEQQSAAIVIAKMNRGQRHHQQNCEAANFC